MRNLARRFFLLATLTLTVGALPSLAEAAAMLDRTPRMAVISAFQPELTLLSSQLKRPRKLLANGVEFSVGTLEGRPVVLFLSGISMTNAAMNTQLVLDRFKITHIVFSGIAGGVNPALHIGDVTVVARWAEYLESVMARDSSTGKGASDHFSPPAGMEMPYPNFGMMYPHSVEVRSAKHLQAERKFWFDVDPKMLAVAKGLHNVKLSTCDAHGNCLDRTPEIVIGGNGVSGQSFVDNAALRQYVFKTFHANVLDMESAACAMVAYSNGVPFIAFRSLSDLAGGSAGANEMHTFMNVAANNSAKVLLAFLAAWK